jgi:crotonobetainyl-CoA:carnitine CoA-transferase CaiB-like acyl-CoA transferase
MQHEPLRGVRVLEIGGYISAPYATSLLAALGADVIKLERPGTGDEFRRQEDDRSVYFVQYNAGKRSLAVDLKHPDGVALVRALIPRFDVVLENLRPGKLDAIGLGYDECTALRDDIVYASVTGFGNGGPLEQRPAYDTIGQAYGGLYTILSDAGAPRLSGTCMTDLLTGLTAAAGILAGLVGRSASGSGQRVETSLMEAVSTVTIDAITQYFDDDHRDPSRQSRHPQAQNFCLKTATGDAIALHLSSSEKFWRAFTDAMEREDLATDPRFASYNTRVANYFPLLEIVEAEFAKRSYHEWEERLLQSDVPFAPVITVSGYIGNPQTQWLQLIEPEQRGVSLVRPPWRFQGSRPSRAGIPPKVGQHTREVAGEVYGHARIEELLASGVLFESDQPYNPRPNRPAGFSASTTADT